MAEPARGNVGADGTGLGVQKTPAALPNTDPVPETAGETKPLGRRLSERLPARVPTRLATPTLLSPTLRRFRRQRQSHGGAPAAPGGGSRGSANRIRLALKQTTAQQKAKTSVIPYSISVGMMEAAAAAAVDEEEEGGGSIRPLLAPLLMKSTSSVAGHREGKNGIQARTAVSIFSKYTPLGLDGTSETQQYRKTNCRDGGHISNSKNGPEERQSQTKQAQERVRGHKQRRKRRGPVRELP